MPFFQVKTEEIAQTVSPTINANDTRAVESDPSRTQSALPADKYENTVEKPSQDTTTEQVKSILHSINGNQQLKCAKTTNGSLGCSLCALKTVTYILFSLYFFFLLFVIVVIDNIVSFMGVHSPKTKRHAQSVSLVCHNTPQILCSHSLDFRSNPHSSFSVFNRLTFVAL